MNLEGLKPKPDETKTVTGLKKVENPTTATNYTVNQILTMN
jgi:hypothetical protein